MLQIKNVNLNVSGVALLHNISIELELGKIYGILGPSVPFKNGYVISPQQNSYPKIRRLYKSDNGK